MLCFLHTRQCDQTHRPEKEEAVEEKQEEKAITSFTFDAAIGGMVRVRVRVRVASFTFDAATAGMVRVRVRVRVIVRVSTKINTFLQWNQSWYINYMFLMPTRFQLDPPQVFS